MRKDCNSQEALLTIRLHHHWAVRKFQTPRRLLQHRLAHRLVYFGHLPALESCVALLQGIHWRSLLQVHLTQVIGKQLGTSSKVGLDGGRSNYVANKHPPFIYCRDKQQYHFRFYIEGSCKRSIYVALEQNRRHLALAENKDVLGMCYFDGILSSSN
uniref:Uncharacterized protein n=1 Tax=Arundo donax TaxID=35708 RepID=A0A0A9DVV3_ARUDO